MKVIEAQDWQSIRDPALKWLGRFTYENAGKRPDKSILAKLQRKYPNTNTKLYRGMNFTSKERWDEFISQFKNNQARLNFDVVTSWAKDTGTATQFALTQPTYQLNYAVMHAHGVQQREREALSGYRGVILSVEVPEGVGIDVDKTQVGHESEVVLPPGEYLVKIHQVLKLYKHQLADGDTTVEGVILGTTPESLRSREREHSFFDYVIHHHGKELSPKAQAHLLKLFKPRAGEPLFKYHVTEGTTIYPDQVSFDYAVPSWKLFDLAMHGVFDDVTLEKIRKLARQTLTQALKPVGENIVAATYFDGRVLYALEKFAGDYRITNVVKRAVGERIRELNASVPAINKLDDVREKRAAVEKYQTELVGLLNKIAR